MRYSTVRIHVTTPSAEAGTARSAVPSVSVARVIGSPSERRKLNSALRARVLMRRCAEPQPADLRTRCRGDGCPIGICTATINRNADGGRIVSRVVVSMYSADEVRHRRGRSMVTVLVRGRASRRAGCHSPLPARRRYCRSASHASERFECLAFAFFDHPQFCTARSIHSKPAPPPRRLLFCDGLVACQEPTHSPSSPHASVSTQPSSVSPLPKNSEAS